MVTGPDAMSEERANEYHPEEGDTNLEKHWLNVLETKLNTALLMKDDDWARELEIKQCVEILQTKFKRLR